MGATSESRRSPKGKKRLREDTEEDTIELLDQSEALELVEFDPTVDPNDSWVQPKVMEEFLLKHFNRALTDEEKKAIISDFPKPSCAALALPKMDDDIKEQLRSRGKDPHFGSEKCLYKLQDQVLDVAGPLTWYL